MKQSFKVLFVCIGNSCRSQMAEALARHIAADVIEPASAGTWPLGMIAEGTETVLEERNVAMDGQQSKALKPEALRWADLIVNMTGEPARRFCPHDLNKVEDWDVMDPYGHDLQIYEVTCDEVESRVGDLARRLRQKRAELKSAHRAS